MFYCLTFTDVHVCDYCVSFRFILLMVRPAISEKMWDGLWNWLTSVMSNTQLYPRWGGLVTYFLFVYSITLFFIFWFVLSVVASKRKWDALYMLLISLALWYMYVTYSTSLCMYLDVYVSRLCECIAYCYNFDVCSIVFWVLFNWISFFVCVHGLICAVRCYTLYNWCL